MIAADMFSHLIPKAISGPIYMTPVPWLSVSSQVSTLYVGEELLAKVLIPNDVATHTSARYAFMEAWFNNPDRVSCGHGWEADNWCPSTISGISLPREQDPTAL